MLPSFSLLLPAFGLLVNKKQTKSKSSWSCWKFKYLFSCSQCKGGTENWARETWSSRLIVNHSRTNFLWTIKTTISKTSKNLQQQNWRWPNCCKTRIDSLLWLLSRRRRGCIFIIKTKIKQLQFPGQRGCSLPKSTWPLPTKNWTCSRFFTYLIFVCNGFLPMYDMHFTLGQGASSWESFSEQKITSENIFQPQNFLFTTNALFCVYVQN